MSRPQLTASSASGEAVYRLDTTTTSMASTVSAPAVEPDAAVAPLPAPSAAAVAPAQSRAEKAAALRAKILAKQGQRMAIVSGHAEALTAVKHSTSTAAAPPSFSAAADIGTPAATAILSPSVTASASQLPRSSLSEPAAAALDITASSSPSSSSTFTTTDTAVSSPPSTGSSVSVVLLTRSLSVSLGLVAAVFPSLLSFSLFLCLLLLMQASVYCLRLSSSGSSVSASPSSQVAEDTALEAAVSRLLPASLSSAVAAANGLASLLLFCTQLVDGCCLFVAVQVAAQAAVHTLRSMYEI